MKKLNHKEIRLLEAGDLVEVTKDSSPIVKGNIQDIKVTSTFVELIFGSKVVQVPTLETSSGRIEVLLDDSLDKYKSESYTKILLEAPQDGIDKLKEEVDSILSKEPDSVAICYDSKCLIYVPFGSFDIIESFLTLEKGIVDKVTITNQ